MSQQTPHSKPSQRPSQRARSSRGARSNGETSNAVWGIVARVDAGELATAAALLHNLHPADQADALALLDHIERRRLLDRIDSHTLAELLPFLTPEELEHVAPDVALPQLTAALDQSSAQLGADVLHALPAVDAELVLDRLPKAPLVQPLLQHDDDSVGGIMAPELMMLGPHLAAEQALTVLRASTPTPTVRDTIYIVDTEGVLLGSIGLHSLVFAPPMTALRDLMEPIGPTVTTDMDQEDALQILQRYGLHALPVLDDRERLVGVATADDLLEIAQQEATEDMYRLVGLVDDEALTAPITTALRRRLPWLLLNLATAFAAAAVVAAFESTLARAAALAIFLPIIAGQGGNAGMQVTTLAVRAMALGEFDRHFTQLVLPRELLIGIVSGTIFGLLVGLVGWAWQDNPWLGLAIGLAMLGTMVVAGLFGLLIPTILRKVGADPALAASIFVTTATDMLGFLFFLGLAALLIQRIA